MFNTAAKALEYYHQVSIRSAETEKKFEQVLRKHKKDHHNRCLTYSCFLALARKKMIKYYNSISLEEIIKIGIKFDTRSSKGFIFGITLSPTLHT